MKSYTRKPIDSDDQSASHSRHPTPAVKDSRTGNQDHLRQLMATSPQHLQQQSIQAKMQQGKIAQLKKTGAQISGTFNQPPALIDAFFTSSNTFGARRFDYSVNFDVDEVGVPGTAGHRMGEFRQYYKGGYVNFGVQSDDYKDNWVEDSLGTAKYGYRNRKTHSSTYVSAADGTGDTLNMWDKPEVQGINKPDEIDYKTDFRGEIVAVNDAGAVTDIIDSKEWTVEGMGCVDKTGKTYRNTSYSQVMAPRTKSANKSKRLRKEAASKYEKPTAEDLVI